MGREVVMAMTREKLDLGPGNGSSTGSSRGRHSKRALVKVIGE
jgi:hypothetical protein